MMFCCSRQVGKSQIAAAIVLLTAITRAPALILLLSPTLRQSQELFRDKVLPLWTPLQHLAPGTETALTLSLDNGSRIISLPESEKGVRGYSGVALLVIDEASRVSDTLYGGVAPMLAVSGGRMLALTTPFGKRGWFFEEWAKAEKEALAGLRPRWETYRVKAPMCPRIPPDFLAEQKESLGDRWYRQEFECNPPEAPVWMGDFSFRPIGDVQAGDEIIGWHMPERGDKQFRRRRLCRARVLGVRRRRSRLVELRMSSGRVLRCTPDHQWLRDYTGSRQHYGVAETGGRLVRVIDPTVPLKDGLERDAFWLGGMYDGEGCADQISQQAGHNEDVRERLAVALDRMGIRWRQDYAGFIMTGDESRSRKQVLVDFLNWCQPVRRHSMDRLVLRANFRNPDEVLSIKELPGAHEVVSMQTATGNYVVWGYASKNCSFEDPIDAVFAEEDIQRAVRHDVQPI
jgi:hypothetical protein